MAGRPPKPTALLKLAGTMRADRHGGSEPPAIDGPLSPPKWLNKSQREGWDFLIDALSKMGLLSSADAPAITSYAVAWGMLVEACANIEQNGVQIEGPNGGEVTNPYVKIRSDAIEKIIKLTGQFGLSPVARARVRGAGKQEVKNDKAKFFNKSS